MKDSRGLSKHLINRNASCKKILVWKEQRPKQGYKSFQSNFYYIFSLHANEVKRFKAVNGIK